MPSYSLLVRIQDASYPLLGALIASLQAQTNPDWELIAVVDHARSQDWALVQDLSAGESRVRTHFAPDSKLLAWVANGMTAQLGTWVGFLHQHDRLVPTALAALAAASHPDAGVVYGEECYRNAYGQQSYLTRKGAFDPLRLLTQEYLGSLAVIRTEDLAVCFDRLATDCPTHGIYLRMQELRGNGGFVYVPQLLIEHHRTYPEPAPKDIRQALHMVRYDLYAIRMALTRRQIPGEVRQLNGTAYIRQTWPDSPGVILWILVDDDVNAGFARLHAVNKTQGYRLVQVRVLHRGSDPDAARDYQELTKALGWSYVRTQAALPALLNQALPYTEHDWLVVLDGTPISALWLAQMMDQARLPGVMAVGGRSTDPRRITTPGLLGYWFEGWDWNTRGRFNRLQVPHQTSALGSSCFLFNTRAARALGPFNENLPTLWAMDYSIRLDQAGHLLAAVPASHIYVTPAAPTAPAERDVLVSQHPGWNCRFGLHQPL